MRTRIPRHMIRIEDARRHRAQRVTHRAPVDADPRRNRGSRAKIIFAELSGTVDAGDDELRRLGVDYHGHGTEEHGHRACDTTRQVCASSHYLVIS